jgi:inward rectifier potassium channel
VAVVAPRNGVPTLMFRVANERANHIAEAQLRVTLMAPEVTKEGDRLRRMVDLPLMRNHSSAFILTWTAMHPLNAHSPLYGATPEQLAEQQVEILVTFTGFDATLSQTIHARYSYVAEEIHWNARFVDILRLRPDGTRQVDYTKFHDTEELPPGASSPAA